MKRYKSNKYKLAFIILFMLLVLSLLLIKNPFKLDTANKTCIISVCP